MLKLFLRETKIPLRLNITQPKQDLKNTRKLSQCCVPRLIFASRLISRVLKSVRSFGLSLGILLPGTDKQIFIFILSHNYSFPDCVFLMNVDQCAYSN
jgi:hypothetical protein